MAKKPNIVWIYCDELRTDALSCYGHPHIRLHTPNLQRLADHGVRFANNFCNSPVCIPSRVCSLTGLYPEDTGVYNNEAGWKNFRLPRRPKTFPQVLTEHGYATANFGKIHVAQEMYPGGDPKNEIFQFHNPEGGGMSFWKDLGESAVKMIRSPNGGMNGGVYPDDQPYLPDKVAENAMAWMDTVKEPFFVRLSILQPHTPVLPPARFVKLYRDQKFDWPARLPETTSAYEKRVAATHGLDRMGPGLLELTRLHYYAQVAWVDEQVGKVLDYLEKKGMTENTVIVFGADHGNPVGDTGAYEKHVYNPTVHRVPLIISRPGHLPQGEVRDDICDSLEMPRTFFAFAGIEPPSVFKGRDLFSAPAPDAIYSTIGFGQPDSRMAPNGGRGTWYGERGWPRRSCIRTSRYRLDKNMRIDAKPVSPEDADIFVSDVVQDSQELINLAGDPVYAQVVRDLCAKLDKHAEGAVEIAHEYLVR